MKESVDFIKIKDYAVKKIAEYAGLSLNEVKKQKEPRTFNVWLFLQLQLYNRGY